MSAITSRGRRGDTVVPNFRWEDPDLDPYDLRVAGWLLSHTDTYLSDHVTRNEIARRTGVSTPRVSKSLERLSDLGIIDIGHTPNARGGGERLVIVFDLDVWKDDAGSHASSMLGATLPAAGSHASSSIGDSEEEHSETPLTPLQGGDVVDDEFLLFWSTYPRKIAKKTARAAFAKAAKDDGARGIAAGLARWSKHWERRRVAVEYIPHPATFLNQQRYNDEPPNGHVGDNGERFYDGCWDTYDPLAAGRGWQ